jgi:hypothetical protein
LKLEVRMTGRVGLSEELQKKRKPVLWQSVQSTWAETGSCLVGIGEEAGMAGGKRGSTDC